MADTTETTDTETTTIEQPELIKYYGKGKKLIFRKNLDRPLTADEVDNNFSLIPISVLNMVKEIQKYMFEQFEQYDKNKNDILVNSYNIKKGGFYTEILKKDYGSRYRFIHSLLFLDISKPDDFVIVKEFKIGLRVVVSVFDEYYTINIDNIVIENEEFDGEKILSVPFSIKNKEDGTDRTDLKIYATCDKDNQTIALMIDTGTYVDSIRVDYKTDDVFLPINKDNTAIISSEIKEE